MAELTVPQVDFSILGNLGKTYNDSRQEAVRQRALSQLGQGGTLDPSVLLSSGDMSLANLGVQIQNRQQDQERQGRLDQRQTSRDAVDDNFRNQSLAIQRAAAARASEGPLEKASQRAKAAETFGLTPGSPEHKTYVLTGKLPDAEGANAASLTPVYGVGPDGKPAMVQPTKSGVAVQTKLPEGFQISRDPIRVDLGTHIQLIDPQTRQPIGSPIHKDLAGAEREKVLGEETAKGQVALPQIMSTAGQTLKAIEDVRNHPGRGWGTGALGTIPGIPGTSQRGFVTALDQLKGKTFLEAFNSLRGGGAITEAEGAKATNAMARLDRAQNDKDFEAGLNDLRDVVKAGMLRAQAKSRGAGSSSPTSAQPQSTGGSVTSSGVKWSVE